MTELVALADKNGWLLVIIILAAYRFIPVLADKIAPEWMQARREASAAKHASMERLTEKVISVVENNSRYVSASAMSMGGMERALDANTQQIARLTEIVRRGPACPLIDCPFMGHNKDG